MKTILIEPNEAAQLNGSAMPHIMASFAAAVVGRKIVKIGYLVDSQGTWPYLELDNGENITASRDDEGNGPGVLSHSSGEMLCHTALRS